MRPEPVTIGGSARRVLAGHVLPLLYGAAGAGALAGLVMAGLVGLVYGLLTGALAGAAFGLALGAVHAVVQVVVLPFVPRRRRHAVAPRLVHVVAVVIAYGVARTPIVYRTEPEWARAAVVLGAVAYAVVAAFLAQRVLPRPPGRRRPR